MPSEVLLQMRCKRRENECTQCKCTCVSVHSVYLLWEWVMIKAGSGWPLLAVAAVLHPCWSTTSFAFMAHTQCTQDLFRDVNPVIFLHWGVACVYMSMESLGMLLGWLTLAVYIMNNVHCWRYLLASLFVSLFVALLHVQHKIQCVLCACLMR